MLHGCLSLHVQRHPGFRTDSREARRGRQDSRSRTELPLTRYQGDYKEPYNWDDYAQVYFPKAEELVSKAQEAEQEGNKEKASEFYL